jgi:dTMP kinase
VLCDRYSDSTVAYQGHGRGGDFEAIRRLDALARDGCAPDLTFLLDCDVPAGLGRAAQRPISGTLEDRLEREPIAFHERVRAGFLDLARREPGRIIILDGARPVDGIARQVAAATLDRLEREGIQ